MLCARKQYRCVATSLEGFVFQVAVSYVGRGYVFYVPGCVPEGKNPHQIDQKLIKKYQIAISKNVRSLRKKNGLANVQYIRWGRFFLVLATHGRHRFFDEEGEGVRDARKTPIRVGGYQIGYRLGHDRKWHPHVRIADNEYKAMRAHLLEVATHRSVANLEFYFRNLPFEAWAPIRRQCFNLLRQVNRTRKKAGYELVPKECIRLRRRIVRPFEPVEKVVELVGRKFGEAA